MSAQFCAGTKMDLGLTAVEASGRVAGGWLDITAEDEPNVGALGAMVRN